MKQIRVTINSPPPTRAPSTGRPFSGKWQDYRSKLQVCRNVAGWSSLELPKNMNITYARRLAWKEGFQTSIDPDNKQLLYVRYREPMKWIK